MSQIEDAVYALNSWASDGDRIHCTGIGKSGIAARFLAESLCTHGIPAGFVHPVDVLHGGLGGIRPSDAVVCISASGRTGELVDLAEHLPGREYVVAILGTDRASELATMAICPVFTEVGPDEDFRTGYCPSASFIAACSAAARIAHGLGVELSRTNPAAHTHPGGNLGATRPWEGPSPLEALSAGEEGA